MGRVISKRRVTLEPTPPEHDEIGERQLMAEGIEQLDVDPLEEIPDPRLTPSEAVELHEQVDRLLSSKQLTAKQVDRFKAWFCDGEPLTAIAAREGKRFPTVNSSVRAAVRKLGLDYATAKRIRGGD